MLCVNEILTEAACEVYQGHCIPRATVSSNELPNRMHFLPASVLRTLARSLFQKFGFFMDCLRIYYKQLDVPKPAYAVAYAMMLDQVQRAEIRNKLSLYSHISSFHIFIK